MFVCLFDCLLFDCSSRESTDCMDLTFKIRWYGFSLERCRVGLIFTLERCRDGMVSALERSRDCMVVTLERCWDGMILTLERRRDGMVVTLERCRDGMVFSSRDVMLVWFWPSRDVKIVWFSSSRYVGIVWWYPLERRKRWYGLGSLERCWFCLILALERRVSPPKLAYASRGGTTALEAYQRLSRAEIPRETLKTMTWLYKDKIELKHLFGTH